MSSDSASSVATGRTSRVRRSVNARESAVAGTRRSDLLLGLVPTTERADHSVTLESGTSVIFYTDGLIERRDRTTNDSLEQLRGVLRGRQQLSAEELCDHLLDHFAESAGRSVSSE
jgi:serine phosphatase RsbU (regulator of sigma subunit)